MDISIAQIKLVDIQTNNTDNFTLPIFLFKFMTITLWPMDRACGWLRAALIFTVCERTSTEATRPPVHPVIRCRSSSYAKMLPLLGRCTGLLNSPLDDTQVNKDPALWSDRWTTGRQSAQTLLQSGS
jgi:hypothetical protein